MCSFLSMSLASEVLAYLALKYFTHILIVYQLFLKPS